LGLLVNRIFELDHMLIYEDILNTSLPESVS